MLYARLVVVPAKAGIQGPPHFGSLWIPAFVATVCIHPVAANTPLS